MTAKSFTCRWSLLALTAVLSFISTVFSSAQPVGIAPDKETLSAPFSPKDEAAFKAPEKVFYPETWFHFIGGNVSKEGIDWAGEKVHLVFLSAIPVAVSAFYLRLMAGLAQAFSKKEVRAAAVAAKDSASLWKMLVKATRHSVK